eukprot:1927912-Amphidinium_carterae.1
MKEAERRSAEPEALVGRVVTFTCVSATIISCSRRIPAFITRLSGMLFNRHMVGRGGCSDMENCWQDCAQENWLKLQCAHVCANDLCQRQRPDEAGTWLRRTQETTQYLTCASPQPADSPHAVFYSHLTPTTAIGDAMPSRSHVCSVHRLVSPFSDALHTGSQQ